MILVLLYCFLIVIPFVHSIDIAFVDQIGISSSNSSSSSSSSNTSYAYNDQMEFYEMVALPSSISSALVIVGPLNENNLNSTQSSAYVYQMKRGSETLVPIDVTDYSHITSVSMAAPLQLFASSSEQVSSAWQLLLRPGLTDISSAVPFSKNVSVVPIMEFTLNGEWSSPFTLFRGSAAWGQLKAPPLNSQFTNQSLIHVTRAGSSCPLSLSFGCDRLPDATFPLDWSLDVTLEAYFVLPVATCSVLYVYVQSKEDCDSTALSFKHATPSSVLLEHVARGQRLSPSTNYSTTYYAVRLPDNGASFHSLRLMVHGLPYIDIPIGPIFTVYDGQPWGSVQYEVEVAPSEPFCGPKSTACSLYTDMVVQSQNVFVSYFSDLIVIYPNMTLELLEGGQAVEGSQPVTLFLRNANAPTQTNELVSNEKRAFCFMFDGSIVNILDHNSPFGLVPRTNAILNSENQPFCVAAPPNSTLPLRVSLSLEWSNLAVNYPVAPNTTIVPIPIVHSQITGSGGARIENNSFVFVDWQPSSPGSLVTVGLKGACADQFPDVNSLYVYENSGRSSLQFFNTGLPVLLYSSPEAGSLTVYQYYSAGDWQDCTLYFSEIAAQSWKENTKLNCQMPKESDECTTILQFHSSTDLGVLNTEFSANLTQVAVVARRNVQPELPFPLNSQPKYMFLSALDSTAVPQSFSNVESFEALAMGSADGLNATTFSAFITWPLILNNSISIQSVVSRSAQKLNIGPSKTILKVSGPKFYHLSADTQFRLLNLRPIPQKEENETTRAPSNVYGGWNGFYVKKPSVYVYSLEIDSLNWYPRSNFFYRSSTDFPFWLYVPSNVTINVMIEPKAAKPLCSPSISCNGNGLCAGASGCACFEGLLFKFSGPTCLHKETTLTVWLLSAGQLLLVLLFTAWSWWTRRQRGLPTIALQSMRPEVEDNDEEEANENIALLDFDRLDSSSAFLAVKGASVTRRGGALLLSNISLCIESPITLIMGSSGAGKSTLLHLLAGKIKPSMGERVCFGSIGFVPQADVLPPWLTVGEAIINSALMRLPSAMSQKKKIRIAESVIDRLSLSHRRNVLIGTFTSSALSGGERKRVSVGLELAALPSLLFFDEPTSGLDSSLSLQFMQLIKRGVASMGIRCILVLHQPRQEIFDQAVDRLIVLRRGEIVFDGSPASAQAPPNANVGDYLLDRVNELQVLSQSLTNLEDDYMIMAGQKKPNRTPSVFQQLRLQIVKTASSQFRSISFLATLYSLTAIASLIIGLIFQDSRYIGPPDLLDIAQCPSRFRSLCAANRKDDYLAQGNIIALALGLVAASSSLSVFGGTEKEFFWRGASSRGFSILAYFLSKMSIELIHVVLAPLLFVSLFSLLSCPPIQFELFWAIVAGVFYTCSGAGYLIGMWTDESRAIVGVVVFVAICSLFGGVSPTIDGVQDQLGSGLGEVLLGASFARWTIESFYSGIMAQYTLTYNVGPTLQGLSYDMENRWWSTFNLFLIGIVLRCLALISIYFSNVNKRK